MNVMKNVEGLIRKTTANAEEEDLVEVDVEKGCQTYLEVLQLICT